MVMVNRGRRGVSVTGYALTAGLIAMVALLAVTMTGRSVSVLFGKVGNTVTLASNGTSVSSTGTGQTQPSACPSDPHWANVSLLLHFDGPHGSTSLVDSSTEAHGLTANGSAVIASISPFSGGTGLYLPSDNSTVSISGGSGFDFGTGDFTMELFLRPENYTTNSWAALIGGANFPNLTDGGFRLYVRSNAAVYFWRIEGSTSTPVNTTSTVSYQNWQHIALVRQSNTYRLYINGTQSTSGTPAAGSIVSEPGGLILGSQSTGGQPYSYRGYMDEVRITKGVARYTANFSPPTQPFCS